MSEYKEKDVIYIKHMRFADSNKLDYRVNGRPYLIYKIEDSAMYLLKINSRKFSPVYFYTEVEVKQKRGNARKCYVDMRYYYVVDARKISIAVDSMFDNEKQKYSKHGSKISDEDFREVKNQVKILEEMGEIKEARINTNFAYVPETK